MGKRLVEEISAREMSSKGIVHPGKCPFGEVSVAEVSARDLSLGE